MTGETRPHSIGWAGIGLIASGFGLVITISIFGGVLGPPSPTQPELGVSILDRANHTLSNWSLLSTIWVAETAFFIMMAASALVLTTRTSGGTSWAPRPIGWALVAVSALLQIIMYAFALGGYPPALAVVATDSLPYDVLYRSSRFLFDVGNITMFVGFSIAYASESGPDGIFKPFVARVGSAVCALTVVLMLVVTAGIASMFVAAPAALAGHALIGYMGVRLVRS